MAGLLWKHRAASQAGSGFPIPADKGFAADWLRSLFERGEPAVARGRELHWIGMPVGGIACGQVYLGGDGKLWLWDVLNQPPPPGFDSSAGPHYERPLEATSPFHLGFALQIERRGGGALLPLSSAGFPEVEFRGTYPIGTVSYRSQSPPLEVVLEAFSPFVPLQLEVSSLPATLLAFTIRNTGSEKLSITLRGTLDNPVGRSGDHGTGEILRTTQAVREEALGMIVHAAERQNIGERPDIPFDDFEGSDYSGWTVEGTAFGSGPASAGSTGASGKQFASSRPPGEGAAPGTGQAGALTSREFIVERNWIHFLLAGSTTPGRTCLELLIDDEVTATATGANEERLRQRGFYVGSWQGRRARLRIADRVGDGPGAIGVDSLVFSDRQPGEPYESRGDTGTMAMGVLGPGEEALLTLSNEETAEMIAPVERATVARRVELEPGAEAEIVFVVAWHFPNPWREKLSFLPDIGQRKRHYAARFGDAEEVARYVAQEHALFAGATRAWRDTWYDSTLPYWLLDRTFASVSTLATSTCIRLDDGRFHGFEGAYCGPGTCTDVWHHAQSPARLFPPLERDQRERIDLGLAFHEDSGQIDSRGEAARELALEGQAGTILRVWREHTCSPDDSFLRRVYPRARKAVECLLARDPDRDGMLEGAPGLSSLYLAALRAGEAMAEETGDAEFAALCRTVREAGAKSIVQRLFDGEHFGPALDPAHPGASAGGQGCAIDQVLGQAWAWQVGLGRVLPERETRSALAALWKYNFAPDVGPYREYMRDKLPGGRWLAMPGEAGLLTCTWPKGGHEVAAGKGAGSAGGNDARSASHSNECMTGFEHQVAAHMLWEGMVEQGLAIERAVHDRYHPAKRNPWNEVECGDHAARAMASYGVYLAVCGFELHGPKGHLGFAPRLHPLQFRAAFTAPEGWGTYTQGIDEASALHAFVELHFGRLRLRTLRIGHSGHARASKADVKLGERALACTLEQEPEAVLLRFAEDVLLGEGDVLSLLCRA